MKNCVVIPIYKEKPELKTIKVLNNNINKCTGWDIVFIVPNFFISDEYTKIFPKIKIEKFFQWENTIDSYNKLLLTKEFYQRFQQYEYMVIAQTDVLLLRSIEYIQQYMEKGWGYIGAPWFHSEYEMGRIVYKRSLHGMGHSVFINKLCRPLLCVVGNGGLSLRNIPRIIRLLKKYSESSKWNNNEDWFFAYYGQLENEFIPAVEIAQTFALEMRAKEKMSMGIVPFGIHAWEKFYPEVIYDFRDMLELEWGGERWVK